jgi:hypothetical protein
MAVSGMSVAGAVGAYSLTPTRATNVASTVDDARKLALSSAAVLSSTSPPQSAFSLTLSIPVTQDVIYSQLAVLNSDSLASATPPADDISQLLEMGLKAHLDSASLLGGLGAQLLDRFATTQSDFRQAVVAYRDPTANGAGDISAAAGASALQNAQYIKNNISLKVYTVSGKEVDLSITFGGDGNSIQDSLSIDVHSSGKLSAAEQTAIAKLSKGFDAALQGITSGPTKVDVSGLVNYDTTVLSGVDLKVRESPQMSALRSLDFHADASRRSFSMQGQAGIVSVSANLSAPALWGSPAQQQTAVVRYLDQFDAANRRAHGGATLLEQFKDAFAQLNSSYLALGQQPAHAPTASVLNAKDRSVLSGLADFQASMSGDFNNGSAAHFTTEAGHIDYEVSQHTETRGVAKRTGFTVVQTQASKLGASFAASRNGAMLDIASGDYDINTLKDSASTSTSFEYADDKLENAAIMNLVNQSESYEKLVNHKIVEQKSTPHNIFTMRDISAQLRPTL